MLTPALLLAATLAATSANTESGVKVGDTKRSASLLQNTQLESHWKPSQNSMLRLIDDIQLHHSDLPMPLDQGGGLSSDVRQILAFVLGFFVGFGLGHLIARDKDGFLLWLIIDVVLIVVGGVVGWAVLGWHRGGPFWIGGLVWFVAHIIQGIDAYGSAGGERLINLARERTVRFANADHDGKLNPPLPTTKIYEFAF